MNTQFEKYSIEVPARIEVKSAEKVRSFFLRTASISAKEVTFLTDQPLPENSHVNLELMLDFARPGKKEKTILINVTGRVANCTPSEMTIMLNEDYQITKVRTEESPDSVVLIAERVF
ncbi:MAG TPA: hypothetical protein VLZ07_10600 [Syntrophales bacterium]|nr:hypothetical protein [Syntrophales bacterium]